MMGKTHLCVGMASALLVALPAAGEGLAVPLAALAGGALGGVTADVDILDNGLFSDAHTSQMSAVGVVALALFADSLFHAGLWKDITASQRALSLGLIAYGVLLVLGFFSAHRTFTHSLLAGALFTGAVSLLSLPLAGFYAIGYGSHLALDLLNRTGMQIFYPLPGRHCLRLCYAGGWANSLLLKGGMGLSALLLALCLLRVFVK